MESLGDGSRIEASLSAALSEDNDNKEKINLLTCTERLLETCLEVEGGVDDMKWERVRSILTTLEKENAGNALVTGIGTFGNIPLHLICFKDPPTDVVEKMLRAAPKSAMIPDKEGDLPLHFACLSGASSDVIRLLVNAYPEGRDVQGELGNTPLHCVLLQEQVPSEDIVQALLTDTVIGIEDNGGRTPLELFSVRMKTVSSNNSSSATGSPFYMNQVTRRELAANITSVLLQKYPVQTQSSSALLKDIETLPNWLQMQVSYTSKTVQSCIDRTMSMRFASFSIFFLLYVNLFVIICFTSAVTSDRNENGNSLTFELYGLRICIVTWVVGLLLQFFSAIFQFRLDQFLFRSPSTWVDVISVFFLIHTMNVFNDPVLQAMHVNTNYLGAEQMKHEAILMGTTILIWVKLFLQLSNLYYPLNSFLMRALFICQCLIPFFITLVFLLTSFALMYYIDSDYRNECVNEDESNEELTFCSFQQSLLKLYSIFVNGFIESSEFNSKSSSSSTTKLALTISFSMVAIVLLLNTLIAVAVDGFKRYRERNIKFYWQQRYKQIQEIEFVKNGLTLPFSLCKNCRKNQKKKRKSISQNSLIPFREDNSKDAILWKNCNSILSNGKQFNVKSNWMLGFLSAPITQSVLRGSVAIFMFLWTILGFLSFTLLHPVQVRRWLVTNTLNSDNQKVINSSKKQNINPFNSYYEGQDNIQLDLKRLELQNEELHNKLNTILSCLRREIGTSDIPKTINNKGTPDLSDMKGGALFQTPEASNRGISTSDSMSLI